MKSGPIPNVLGVFFHNFEDWNFRSVTIHTSYMVTIYYHCILFSFGFMMEKVCVIAKKIFTKNDIIVQYNKFLNLGVYHANFFPTSNALVKAPFQKLQKQIPGSFK